MRSEPIKTISTPDIALLIDGIIEAAATRNASDIHIDPCESCMGVSFRVDGLISLYATFEKTLISEIIGRIKVLSSLRGDTHDKSQDGRFHTDCKSMRIDIRVSIAPTYYGENAVLRLLYQHQQKTKTLIDLGFTDAHQKTVFDALKKNQGLIIVAGPTGAGKTSTLYAMLGELVNKDRVIISLEDPVEYPLTGVRQIQLKPDSGYSFAGALRGVLRQDPDIIMLGEMRDKETAAIAVQIALTGHLVMTSIHAEDAAHVIPRLIDMDIDPYLLSATLRVLIGQRLVRRVDRDGDGLLSYRGREAIGEVMGVNSTIQKLILKRPTATTIVISAKRKGFITLYEHAEEKIKQGITTTEELIRVLYE